MNKIYPNAEEKLVSAVMLYADADEGNVFVDAAKTEKVKKDVLVELFNMKKVLVTFNSKVFAPTCLFVADGAATITAIGCGSSGSLVCYHFSSDTEE